MPSFFKTANAFILIGLLMNVKSAKAQQVQADVKVSGKILSYNGSSKVPIGLFGVHAGNFQGFNAQTVQKWGIESVRTIQTIPTGNTYSPPAGVNQVIDCWFDRFQPARNVEQPLSWKPLFHQRATQYAANIASLDREVIFEFWNEPYLNWAYKPGTNTDPQFFDTTGRTLGGPCRLKGKSEPEPYLKWKMAQWYNSPNWAANRQGIYNAISSAWNQMLTVRNVPYPGLTGALLTGDIFNAGTNRQFEVIEALRPVDTTQLSFYSGRQNSLYYNEMYGVAADTLRKLNPNLLLAAGWGFEVHADGWKPWKDLFKPLIDEHHEKIDVIHEHHYGMDTRIVTADYETIYAYTFNKFGRRLKFINTETGGYLDPQRPGNVGNSAGNVTAKNRALNAFIYNSKDILYMLAHSQDKGYARAIHEPQNTNGGAGFSLQNLKSLRGSFLHAGSSNNQIWPVATLSGDSLLTLVCFNNLLESANLNVEILAPAGKIFASGTVQVVDTSANADTLSILAQNIPISGTVFSSTELLPSFKTKTWKLRLSENAVVPDTVKINQFFADSILTRIGANQSATFPISIPASAALGTYARLKFVAQNGQPNISINGTPLTYVYMGDSASKNRGGISYAHIPAGVLSDQNVITATTTASGSEIWMMSLEVADAPFVTKQAERLTVKQVIKVFPNPFSNQITIHTEDRQQIKQILIVDALGRIVFTESSLNAANSFKRTLNTAFLKKGLYFGKVETENSQAVQHFKLIKE